MDFKSHSQAGQDRFVHHVLAGMREGVFVDCGCNHPIEMSNTYTLEKDYGWRGLLVDNDQNCVDLCKKERVSKVFMGDGVTSDWRYGLGCAMGVFADVSGKTGSEYTALYRELFDYLSLDCDQATLGVFQSILDATPRRFRVITVETDAYRFGPGPRDAMLALLKQHGYEVLCADVCCTPGMPFEIWAVDPKLVDMKLADRFRRDKPTCYLDFFQ